MVKPLGARLSVGCSAENVGCNRSWQCDWSMMMRAVPYSACYAIDDRHASRAIQQCDSTLDGCYIVGSHLVPTWCGPCSKVHAAARSER